ncbi:MAG: NAD(P)-binding domain-containing protein, partial [Microthrixaceae bacterium]
MRRSGSTVAIVGVGVVGGRLARELVSADPEIEIELHARSEHRRQALTDAFGADVTICDGDADVSDSVRVVVLAGPQDAHPEAAAMHLAAGRHVISAADRPDVIASL